MTERVAGLDVSRETSERLRLLADLLRKWSPRINLVAKGTLEEAWERHVVDSAQIFALRPAGARDWADLGSGGGFPGLVIAALAAEAAPELRVTLVESDSRKCAFLATAAREMGVEARVVTSRIEALPRTVRDVVSARALAPLPRLLELAEGQAGPGTICLFPKGAGAACELTRAARNWHIRHRAHPSVTDPNAVVLELQEFSRVPQDRS